MTNLKISRYDDPKLAAEFAGYIEPADESWIIWLNGDGQPALYFPKRDAGGAVDYDGVVVCDPAYQSYTEAAYEK